MKSAKPNIEQILDDEILENPEQATKSNNKNPITAYEVRNMIIIRKLTQ